MHHTEAFFREGRANDPIYRTIRDDDHPNCREARDFVEELWHRSGEFLDARLPEDARHAFRSRFWEMYVAVALLEHNVALVPRRHRTPKEKGPDLLLADGETWVEAVLAQPGDGADAVPDPPLDGEVTSVPDEAVALRLASAIAAKNAKYRAYRADGTLSPTARFVVAVGGSEIWAARHELPIPRIVRCVFPFGGLEILVDRETGSFGDARYAHQDRLTKRSGAPVSTDVFLGEDFAGVSAVLYARADELNHATRVGSEFVMVHNSRALNPIEPGSMPLGSEYWQDGDVLRRRRHRSGGGERAGVEASGR